MFRRMFRGVMRRIQPLTPEQRAAEEMLALGNAIRSASAELFTDLWQDVEDFLTRDVRPMLKVYLLEFVLDRDDLTDELLEQIRQYYKEFSIADDAARTIEALEKYLRDLE